MLATALGVLLSIPIAFMSARNVAPKPVFYLGRAIIIIARSFHPVIVAILFVKAVGFGPFAGVLTLTVYSIGFVAKMLAERIEEIDFGQVEAMRAAGAPYFSTLSYAIFPQIMPRQIGLTIYQLDSNLRASAVVGIVGAGGIGATLANAFGRYDYDFALAITIVIVGVILFPRPSAALSESVSNDLTFHAIRARRLVPLYVQATYDALCDLSGLWAGHRLGAHLDRGDLAVGLGCP